MATAVTQVCKALASNACLTPLADKRSHSTGFRLSGLSNCQLRAYRGDLNGGKLSIHYRQYEKKRHQQGLQTVCAEAEVTPPREGTNSAAASEDVTGFKHILLPILDRNPYLSEATRQVTATGAGLAKKFGADVTVVVIDEDAKESIADHETRMKSIRFHMAEGGFEDFGLLERLGEGKKPAAVVGEVADDLNLDLVVMSMESIHHKHIDGNLLAEFVPCPILLLPL